jgi:hypothetical protein
VSNSIFSAVIVSVLSSLLVGCSTPSIMLDRAVILNATSNMITDVRVRHEPTGSIGAVNAVLPGKTLNLGFPIQPMLAEEGIVTWTDRSGETRRSQLTLPTYDSAMKDIHYTLVYTIKATGAVTVHLEK